MPGKYENSFAVPTFWLCYCPPSLSLPLSISFCLCEHAHAFPLTSLAALCFPSLCVKRTWEGQTNHRQVRLTQVTQLTRVTQATQVTLPSWPCLVSLVSSRLSPSLCGLPNGWNWKQNEKFLKYLQFKEINSTWSIRFQLVRFPRKSVKLSCDAFWLFLSANNAIIRLTALWYSSVIPLCFIVSQSIHYIDANTRCVMSTSKWTNKLCCRLPKRGSGSESSLEEDKSHFIQYSFEERYLSKLMFSLYHKWLP